MYDLVDVLAVVTPVLDAIAVPKVLPKLLHRSQSIQVNGLKHGCHHRDIREALQD